VQFVGSGTILSRFPDRGLDLEDRAKVWGKGVVEEALERRIQCWVIVEIVVWEGRRWNGGTYDNVMPGHLAELLCSLKDEGCINRSLAEVSMMAVNGNYRLHFHNADNLYSVLSGCLPIPTRYRSLFRSRS